MALAIADRRIYLKLALTRNNPPQIQAFSQTPPVNRQRVSIGGGTATKQEWSVVRGASEMASLWVCTTLRSSWPYREPAKFATNTHIVIVIIDDKYTDITLF
jgi:hypothetical protein